MSHSRKHVTDSVLTALPLPTDNQKIAQVVGIRGSNQQEIVYPSGEKVLCLIPSKFVKKIWIKRGDYVIVTPADNITAASTSKILATLQHVLYDAQIKHIKDNGLWPSEFKIEEQIDNKQTSNANAKSNSKSSNNKSKPESDEEDEEEEEDDDDDDLFVNSNRRVVEFSDEESDEDDEDEEDEEE